MRKTGLILLLALCFCLTAACGAEDVLGTAATDAPAAEEPAQAGDMDAASETDAAPAEAEPAGEASDTDVSAPAEPEDAGTEAPALSFTELTAEQCVTDALEEPGVLPRLTLDCPGAEEINGQIAERFTGETEDPNWIVHYEVFKAGDVLSLLMVEQTANDCTYYTPYRLDLATGQTLSAQALLEKLSLDGDALVDREVQVMAEEFDHRFGDVKDMTDPDFYDGQRERTTDLVNGETERIWLDDDGQLRFVGRIYGMAGAEYYEYPLAAGLYLG